MPKATTYLRTEIPNVNAGQWAGIQGRNGFFYLTAIELVHRETSAGMVVDILGIGQRGFALNAGLYHVPEHIMDQICIEWLKRKLPDPTTDLVTKEEG